MRNTNSLPIFFIAAAVGMVGGSLCVAMLFGLRFLQWLLTGHSGLVASAATEMPLWRRVVTPVLGAILATVVVKASQRFGPREKAVDYVEAVRFHGGQMAFGATLWRTLSSSFSIASGAAIGREGSMIQFATSGVAALGVRWHQDFITLERLVVLGTAASVASVYQAPVAGVFFTLEIVLGIQSFSRQGLLQMPALLISAGIGGFMSDLFLGNKPLFTAPATVHFTWHDCLPICLLAILIGGFGPVYFKTVHALRFLKKLPWAMVASGVAVGLLSCIRTETWGNGNSGVLEVMGRSVPLQVVALILVLRLGAISACVGSGVVGGVFTPTVFAGSALGLLSGTLGVGFFPHSSPAVSYAVLGIACLLSAVTHAPLMAALMAVELTGSWRWLPVMLIGSFLSFWIAKNISSESMYAVAAPDPGKSEPGDAAQKS